VLRSFDPLSVPRITFGQLGRQAERPETLNDRALQLVIGERIKLAGCADTRDKARGLRSTQALSLSAILESARSTCLQPDDRGTDERRLECYSGVAPTE